MKLISFSVTNYRSITTAHKIRLNDLTVLVGKNNEGKSNILKALALTMDIMNMYSDDPKIIMRTYTIRRMYDWERDFPVSRQLNKRNLESIFNLDFSLNEEEIIELKNITGIRLSTIIPIRMSIGKNSTKIDIPKQGSSAFKANSQRIIAFICKKITFNYIPAIRTEGDTLSVINKIISSRLETIEEKTEYIKAINLIDNLQQGVLDEIAKNIKDTLSVFLPSIKNISIQIEKDQRRVALRRNTKVIIDDGNATAIELKGDGIKSLTALAMLNLKSIKDKSSVIAIEEPESHLHSGAMHQIYNTIQELSINNQIVITTHSPLFVNRINLKNNIIVQSGKATPVKHIKEIRETLGIIVSDNLYNANYILVVEGEDDKILVTKIFNSASEKIKKALKNNILLIESINGAGNLSFKLNSYRDIQCIYHICWIMMKQVELLLLKQKNKIWLR